MAQTTQQTATTQKQTYTITTKDGYEATVEADGNEDITLKEVLTPTQVKAKKVASAQSANLITGNITVSAPTWTANENATVTLSTTTAFNIQWQKNSISGMWVAGTIVEGLKHGDTVFTRLIDDEGNAADEASVSILDSIEPEPATIMPLPTNANTSETITANVTHVDNQSKIDITKCKWLFNTTSTNLNVNSTDWNTAPTFSTNTNQISITIPTAPGNYYLHVLSVDIAGNKKETISNQVQVKQLATGITVNPTSAEVEAGKTVKLSATVLPENTSNKSVTWSSQNTSIATVSSTGLVTGVKEGTVTITAKTADKTNKTANCTVTVKLNYIGCYADIEGDGTVDGIIYADLAVGGSGEWGNSDGTYSIPKVTTGLKEYVVSTKTYEGQTTSGIYKANDGFGTKQVIAPVAGSSGKERFYIMALDDVKLKNPISGTSNSVYWYYNAYEKMSDYDKYTTTSFGSGKENTKKMIARWKKDNSVVTDATAVDYGAQNEKDLWGQIDAEVDKGWYVPSKEEWCAFAQNLRITRNNYTSRGLNNTYHSSSQGGTTAAWSANFYTGDMANFIVGGPYFHSDGFFGRLSATF